LVQIECRSRAFSDQVDRLIEENAINNNN